MLLVTGATGYLGAALCEYLAGRGAELRALVRTPARAHILPDSVDRIRGDLADEASLVRAMAGCEGVLHLAAALGGQTPEGTRETNVAGTRRVLRAAVRAGVRRLVFTSSSAAIIDSSGLISEHAANATALVDPYSRSKAEADGLVLAAAREGLDARIVNVVNAYGPSPAGALSYNALLLAGMRGEIDALVDARVGWVLAEDVAAGHALVYERGERGRRYVLCGALATFPEVLGRACTLWGTPRQIRALAPGTALPPDASFYATRSAAYGALGPAHVDDAQARSLGFAPRGLEDGLRLTVAWLKRLEAAATPER